MKIEARHSCDRYFLKVTRISADLSTDWHGKVFWASVLIRGQIRANPCYPSFLSPTFDQSPPSDRVINASSIHLPQMPLLRTRWCTALYSAAASSGAVRRENTSIS